MPVGQISPSHLGTCLSLPGLGSLKPRLALVSLPISPLGTQPEARCPVPPHGAPEEHNLLLWVHVIVRLGAHGWGGGEATRDTDRRLSPNCPHVPPGQRPEKRPAQAQYCRKHYNHHFHKRPSQKQLLCLCLRPINKFSPGACESSIYKASHQGQI